MKDAVDCPQEGGPSLIVENNNDAGGRQRRAAMKLPFNAPEIGMSRQNMRQRVVQQ